MYLTRVMQIQYIKYTDTVSDLKRGNTFFFRGRKFLERKTSARKILFPNCQLFFLFTDTQRPSTLTPS